MTWRKVRLDEVSTICGGSTPRRDNKIYWNGDILWVTPTDLPMPGEGIAVVSDTADKITEDGLNSCSAPLLPAGTVLFSSRATIGKIGISAAPLTTNQGFANFIPHECIDAKFLAYSLLYHTKDIAALSGTTTFKEVSRGNIRKFQIQLPSLSEQRRIVEILDQADALRKKRADADAKAARILPALFLKMFGDPATNLMGWDIVPVSKFVDRFEGGRSIVAKSQETDSATYRILKVSAVTWGKYQPKESKPVPSEYSPSESHFVRAGDLLFSRANTTELVGAVAYVHETPPNLLLPDKIWRFVWRNPADIDPLFVYSLFKHPSVKYELGKRATGTSGSMQNISMGKVLSMEVPLPPSKLQRKFGEFAARINSIEFQCDNSNELINKLFHKLLHDAFSGELTAKWREAHMKELLAEMEAQKKTLEAADSQAALSF